jgi:type I restriction enzyme M protein
VENLHLHTIVRLPKGVFEPYSDIQTNLLFFDSMGATDGIWYYQHEVPETRKEMRDPKYTVTSPLQYEELAPIKKWWSNKESSLSAWFVKREEISQKEYSLDFRNPSRAERTFVSLTKMSRSTSDSVAKLVKSSEALCELSDEVQQLTKSKWEKRALKELLTRDREEVPINNKVEYAQVTVRLYGKGVIERGRLLGKNIKTRPQFVAHANNLIMSRIDARNGAFGIIPTYLEGAVVTQDFPMFRIEPTIIIPEYLALLLKSEEFIEICKRSSRGTTNRKRLREDLLLSEQVPVPPQAVQLKILNFVNRVAEIAAALVMLLSRPKK